MAVGAPRERSFCSDTPMRPPHSEPSPAQSRRRYFCVLFCLVPQIPR
jgi:hypothetical protein